MPSFAVQLYGFISLQSFIKCEENRFDVYKLYYRCASNFLKWVKKNETYNNSSF